MSRQVTSFGSMYPVLAMYIIVGMVKASSIQFETQIGIKVKDELNFVDGESFSRLQCAAQCTGNTSCSTASYNKNNGVCLMSEHRAIGPANQQKRDIVGSFWMVLSKIVPGDVCPDDWTIIGDGCYYLEPVTRNHTQAEVTDVAVDTNYDTLFDTVMKHCLCGNELRAHKRVQAVGLFKEGSHFYTVALSVNTKGAWRTWIGLTDEVEEGRFVWASDGVEVDYDLTTLANSNEGVEDNCVLYNIFLGMSWEVVNCNRNHALICERI